jgi:hypothetical protein
MSAYAAHHCIHTAERSPLHDVRQPASRDRRRRDTNSGSWTKARKKTTPLDTEFGGARRNRTDDLLLAKQALSQLSYGPGCRSANLVGLGRLELPTSRLSSARSNQLSYKPKARYGPKTGPRSSRMDKCRRGLVHERKRNEDGGVLPMDLTGFETDRP